MGSRAHQSTDRQSTSPRIDQSTHFRQQLARGGPTGRGQGSQLQEHPPSESTGGPPEPVPGRQCGLQCHPWTSALNTFGSGRPRLWTPSTPGIWQGFSLRHTRRRQSYVGQDQPGTPTCPTPPLRVPYSGQTIILRQPGSTATAYPQGTRAAVTARTAEYNKEIFLYAFIQTLIYNICIY